MPSERAEARESVGSVNFYPRSQRDNKRRDGYRRDSPASLRTDPWLLRPVSDQREEYIGNKEVNIPRQYPHKVPTVAKTIDTLPSQPPTPAPNITTPFSTRYAHLLERCRCTASGRLVYVCRAWTRFLLVHCKIHSANPSISGRKAKRIRNIAYKLSLLRAR